MPFEQLYSGLRANRKELKSSKVQGEHITGWTKECQSLERTVYIAVEWSIVGMLKQETLSANEKEEQ